MKVVDAVWEKRNLGVSTVEITIEQDDEWNDIKRTLEETAAEYTVIRLPSLRSDLLFKVQGMGFMYAEDMISLVHYLKCPPLSSVGKRIYDKLVCRLLTDSDMPELIRKVESGMFAVDRISLDSYFPAGLSNKRYVNWIKDEISRGTEFISSMYNGEPLGFTAIKETEKGNYTSFLGGIYPEYQKGGFGSVTNYKLIEEIVKRGGKKLTIAVSSNNATQVKTTVSVGFCPESISHIFIKHKENTNAG